MITFPTSPPSPVIPAKRMADEASARVYAAAAAHAWCSVRVPAKALLFGEYGLLFGKTGVVAVLPQPVFDLRVTLAPGEGVEVRSAFFPAGRIFFALGKEEADPATRLLRGALWPFAGALQGVRAIIDVERAFPPDLGLGSSSALIAAIHFCLERLLATQLESGAAVRWRRLQESLEQGQGGGSGYDVWTQFHAASVIDGEAAVADGEAMEQRPELRISTFVRPAADVPRNALSAAGVPRNARLANAEALRAELGILVRSGSYSCTATALQTHGGSEAFAMAHARIAEAASALPWTPDRLKSWFQESRAVAHAQGILPRAAELPESEAFAILLRWLEGAGVEYKSMGAGGGDCLWALCRRDALPPELRCRVAFAFEDVHP